MKQDAFFQTIIHHIGGEGNVARKRFDGEHLYVTVKDSGMADLEELNRLDGVSGTELNRNILSVTIQEDFLEDVTMAKDLRNIFTWFKAAKQRAVTNTKFKITIYAAL